MQLYSGAPYWLVRNGLTAEPKRTALRCDCDVVVIGAGITGALVADALASQDRQVVILERKLAATGSTAATTALVQYEIDVELVKLIEIVGHDQGVRAYQLCVRAIEDIERLVQSFGDDCGFARQPSLYLASRHRHARRLRREAELRAEQGIPAEWWDSDRVRDTFGFESSGAIWSAIGAVVDPVRLTRCALERAIRSGAQLMERVEVVEVRPHDDSVVVHTDTGLVCHARRVVYATGYEIPPFVDASLCELHTTYAVATEPMPHWGSWKGDCLVWESARPYFYMRGSDDGRVIAGGEDVAWKSEVARSTLLPKKVERLTARLTEMLAASPVDVAFAWAGTFAETADGMPYVGPVPASPRVLVALGYGGNGITYSSIAATILRDLCLECPNADADLFSLDRTK